MSELIQLNYGLFQAINNHAGSLPWFDSIMEFCANLLIFFWPLLLLMIWGIPLRWRRQTIAERERMMLEERRAAVIWVIAACLVAYGINLLIEQFVFEPRPFVSHHVHLLVTHVADSSFPSDHTAWSFAVVGILWFALWPLLPFARHRSGQDNADQSSSQLLLLVLLIVALLMACVIGFARVYVGVHYPDDIAGGAIDGLSAAYLVTLLRKWLRRPTQAVLHLAYVLRIA